MGKIVVVRFFFCRVYIYVVCDNAYEIKTKFSFELATSLIDHLAFYYLQFQYLLKLAGDDTMTLYLKNRLQCICLTIQLCSKQKTQ